MLLMRRTAADPAVDAALIVEQHGAALKVISTSGEILLDSKKGEWRTLQAGTGPTWGVVLRDEAGAIRLIDKWGKQTLNPPGIPFDDFHEGLAPAWASGNGKAKCGYLDRDHHMAIAAEYQRCLPFSEGLALVLGDTGWGHIDRSGQMRISARYTDGCKFSEGAAKVKRGGRWMFLDGQGTELFPVDYEGCGAFSSGLAIAKRGVLFGYVDHSGQWAISPRFQGGSNFQEGRAFVWSEKQIGMIDEQGREFEIPKLSEQGDFEHGLARVRIGRHWGLIDRGGHMAVTAHYRKIDGLESGLRKAICDDGQIDFLDEAGAPVKPPVPHCVAYAGGLFTCPAGPVQSYVYLTRAGKQIGGVRFNP